MVLEYLKLSFRTVSRYGDTGVRSRVFHFAGGTLGGKHTLAINSNSLNLNNPEVLRTFYLLNLESRKTDKFCHL